MHPTSYEICVVMEGTGKLIINHYILLDPKPEYLGVLPPNMVLGAKLATVPKTLHLRRGRRVHFRNSCGHQVPSS